MKMIDDTAEWRNFSDEVGEDPRRVGMPNNELLGDKGLGTIISDSNLKIWALRSSYSSLDSALLKTFIEIEHICDSLSLASAIKEKSKKLFRHVYLKKITKGKSHMGVVCSCIFITCRKFKNNCSVYDIARECCVDKMKLYKAFLIVREHASEVFPLSNAQILANTVAKNFGFNDQLIEKVEKLVEEISEFKNHKENNEVLAILAVFVIDWLSGCNRKMEVFLKDVNINEEYFKKLYREIFIHRFQLMSNLGTNWEIANLPNL